MKTTFLLLASLLTCFTLAAQGEQLFDDSQLHEIRFELVDTNIFIASKDYQQVNMFVDGVLVDSVGFKKKGNISAFHINNKFPFKVKTNKYVSGKEYDDIKEFTLHNNYEDPSLLREKMTYDLLLDLGLYSLRTAFSRIYINDVYWGLYTIVEGKDEMYKHVFDNRDGAVLESNDFGDMCYEGPTQADYYIDFLDDYPYALDNGDEATAWASFPTMLDKANNTSAINYMTEVPNYLNVEDFFTFQAANVYLLNFDNYIAFRGNQLYYLDESTNVWQVIPWDFNASFGLWNTNNHRPFDYSFLPLAITNGCIASKVNDVPALANAYNGAICSLLNEWADTTRLINRIDQLRGQIETAVYEDSRKDLSNERFDQATEYGYFSHASEEFVPSLKTFVIDRWEYVTQQIGLTNIDCDALTSTAEQQSIAELLLYPNPAREEVQIRLNNSDDRQIHRVVLYNAAGQQLQNVPAGLQSSLNLDLSVQKAGFYWLKIYLSEQTFVTRRIVKM